MRRTHLLFVYTICKRPFWILTRKRDFLYYCFLFQTLQNRTRQPRKHQKNTLFTVKKYTP
jgi:hypothetical protein